MTDIRTFDRNEDIEQLRETWESLRQTSESNVPSIEEYLNSVASDDEVLSPLVLAVTEKDQITSILPFAVLRKPKTFVIGELCLIRMDHRVLLLVSPVMGDLRLDSANAVVEYLANEKSYDAVNFWEVPADSNLTRAAQDESRGLKVSPVINDVYPHWVIDLPETFDAYLGSFKSKTRSTLKRKIRRFEEAHEVVFERITDTGSVTRFLDLGESISRKTYQWALGTRLVNDERHRSEFEICARQRELYCCLLYADGEAIAFSRGHLRNDVFHYQTPGFLREYAKWSPGNIMLLKMIEDLIENTTCRRFDFGMGGDFTGYKAQFGNRHYEATVLEFFPCKTARSRLIYVLEKVFWRIKRLLRSIVSKEMKSRANRILRKAGLLK